MLTAHRMPSANSLCDDGLEDQPLKKEGNCWAHYMSEAPNVITVSEAPNAITVLRVCIWKWVIPVDSRNGFCMQKSHRLRHPRHMRQATPTNIRRTFLAKSWANKANSNLGYEIGTDIDEEGWEVVCIWNTSWEQTSHMLLLPSLYVYKEAVNFLREMAVISSLSNPKSSPANILLLCYL